MARHTGKGDIESQLGRLDEALKKMPADRRAAFFRMLEEGEDRMDTPPGGKRPTPLAKVERPVLQGAVRLAGKKRSTSVAISEPLLAALKQYSLEQGTRLSISALVELLIWQFLGSPTELIEKTPQAYKPRGVNVKDPMDAMFLEDIGNQCFEVIGAAIESGNTTHDED